MYFILFSVLSEHGRSREFIPDFTVKVLTDVQYLFITQSDYMAALHATRMMRQSGSINIDPGSDVDGWKINQNQNSMFSNNSPPYPHSPLNALKDDEANTKRSTSSLDRLAFFQRKPDPHEILHRMRRTGSDAKERSENFQPDPRKHSIDSSHPSSTVGMGDPTLTSPRKLFTDGHSKRWPLSSSQPFKTASNHKLDFLIEDEAADTEKHGLQKRPSVEKPSSAPQSSVLQPPPAYAHLAEGESSSINSTGTSPRDSTLLDGAVSVHASPNDLEQPLTGDPSSTRRAVIGLQGPTVEQLEMIKFGAGDSDRDPLMQKNEKATNDITTSVKL